MKVQHLKIKPPRIEMLPLIDIVFLLLVVFIYTMLSMAVHKGLPVILPSSRQAQIEAEQPRVLSITARADGRIFVDKRPVPLEELPAVLQQQSGKDQPAGVLLFADKSLTYQFLFKVLDRINQAGIQRVNLQAESEDKP
jgi:biopolymer transport protein ExbD